MNAVIIEWSPQMFRGLALLDDQREACIHGLVSGSIRLKQDETLAEGLKLVNVLVQQNRTLDIMYAETLAANEQRRAGQYKIRVRTDSPRDSNMCVTIKCNFFIYAGRNARLIHCLSDLHRRIREEVGLYVELHEKDHTRLDIRVPGNTSHEDQKQIARKVIPIMKELYELEKLEVS